MLFLYYVGIRLLAGHQKSTDEYVQYCITKKIKPAWDADLFLTYHYFNETHSIKVVVIIII